MGADWHGFLVCVLVGLVLVLVAVIRDNVVQRRLVRRQAAVLGDLRPARPGRWAR